MAGLYWHFVDLVWVFIFTLFYLLLESRRRDERAHARREPLQIYWITWGILLVITVAMLAAEKFHMPRWFLVLFLLAFMMVKAAMIGGNFMHLRFEKGEPRP